MIFSSQELHPIQLHLHNANTIDDCSQSENQREFRSRVFCIDLLFVGVTCCDTQIDSVFNCFVVEKDRRQGVIMM